MNLKEKLESLPVLTDPAAIQRRDQWIRLMRIDLRKAQDSMKRGALSEKSYRAGIKKIFSSLERSDAAFWFEETNRRGRQNLETAGFKYLGLFE